jgi:hypothetical protein
LQISRRGQRRKSPVASGCDKNNKHDKGKPMHRSLIVLPAVLSMSLGACVVGSATGQTYSEAQRHNYSGFSKVDVSAGVEVVVAQGAFDVQAETTEGEGFDNLIVEVNGDTLRISRKSQMWNIGGPRYRVTVSAPAYSEFDVSSGASLKADSLRLDAVEVGVSSGASVQIAGTCTALELDMSSGASFSGEGLRCETAKVDASSGASARAFAARSAKGNASSGASVSFSGNPAELERDTSSGGSVSAR